VVEQWNAATDFVLLARRGELVSNRPEDHEISMLALHLIQNCMVYMHTLVIEKVLAQLRWHGRLTPRDYPALTPLIWEHVNPYRRFDSVERYEWRCTYPALFRDVAGTR
jgi:hypothetical protein